MGTACKRCNSTDIVKNGNVRSKQRVTTQVLC